jgi:hypothetical protein
MVKAEYAIGGISAHREFSPPIAKTEGLVMLFVANRFVLGCMFTATAGLIAENAWAHTASLDWLAGDWCMTTDNQSVEETWSSDAGGQLIGMGRTMVGGRVVAFEFMRIESEPGSTQYFAQPGGGAATVFTASLVSKNHLVVENPAHDFPQKIVYQREANALTATISGPGDDGQEKSIRFAYTACGE